MTTIQIENSKRLIQTMLERFSRPCVLWSGGKDSMVLLHLVRAFRKDIDVVCWREPWMPEKQEFANRIIKLWNLTVWDWHPQRVSFCKGNDRVDILNWYNWGASPVMLARGTERPVEGKPWLCARDTFLARPLQSFVPPWDLGFHGHRSSDVDLCSGSIPLEVDMMNTPGTIPTVFPLRHWSDDDIFEYTEEQKLPIDLHRYRKVGAKWEVLPYQEKNPDFYPTCVKCLDEDEGEFVQCPKLNAQINNISNFVKWEKPRMAYCGLRKESEELNNGV